MSIVRVDAESPRVAVEDVVDIAAKGGIKLSDQMATDFVTLVSGLEAVIANLPDDSCVIPIPDLSRYPRTDIHVPEDNDLGGWATKVGNSHLRRLCMADRDSGYCEMHSSYQ
jgi:amidase